MSERDARRFGGADGPGGGRGGAEEPGIPRRDPPSGARGEEPGSWGTAAMAVLLGLFVLAVAATVHSLIMTFGS